MTRPSVPATVQAAAEARSRARAERDWSEADRLRAEIEAAGWTVVDQGTAFTLDPAAPPDIEDGERVRYGSSTNVPSRFADPDVGVATVVLVATDRPDDVERALRGLAAHAPSGTSVVVVADAPSAAQATALDTPGGTLGEGTEVVWTSARLGTAAALDIGFRRATGPVVIVLDTSVEPTGDLVSPLLGALDDATVGVTGGWGTVSTDLRTFSDAPPGDVDAIRGDLLAFRRADAAERGPLDERFRFSRHLDTWWSLVLRDEGEGQVPRRAVVVADVPAVRHEHRGWPSLDDAERARQAKRNFYRVLERFGSRRDLLTGRG